MKASDYFHGKEKYNCAQAVLHYFRELFPVTDELIKQFKKCGGGRVGDGLCGAVFAAHHLLDDSDLKARFSRLFSERAGSVKCKEIRKKGSISCGECVDCSAEILEDLIE